MDKKSGPNINLTVLKTDPGGNQSSGFCHVSVKQKKSGAYLTIYFPPFNRRHVRGKKVRDKLLQLSVVNSRAGKLPDTIYEITLFAFPEWLAKFCDWNSVTDWQFRLLVFAVPFLRHIPRYISCPRLCPSRNVNSPALCLSGKIVLLYKL